jgi:hypothetical protein
MLNSATVMEENSFTFLRVHKVLPGDKVPPGYRVKWCDRHLLATAKLGGKLKPSGQNFNELLLSCEGNRQTDDFMEVHIYGEFNNRSIASIATPKVKKEKAMANRIADNAKRLDIQCQKL